MPKPRGLIGLLKVSFDGETFAREVVECFDAYGNSAAKRPDVSWSRPGTGEERWFVFAEETAFPEGGADGFEFAAEGGLGERSACGRFFIWEILGSGTVTMRFRDEVRTAEVELPETEKVTEGEVGVAIAYLDEEMDPDTWIFWEVTRIDYKYIDETGKSIVPIVDVPTDKNHPDRIKDVDTLPVTPDWWQYVVFIFCTDGLEYGTDWTLKGVDDISALPVIKNGSHLFYELERFDDCYWYPDFDYELTFGENTMTFWCRNGTMV